MTFSNVPKERLLLYLFILGLLPLALVMMHTQNAQAEIQSISLQVDEAREKILLLSSKQQVNKAVKKQYVNSDRYYLDKVLERTPLMKKERLELNRLIGEDGSLINGNLANRLNFLEKENRISFVQGNITDYKTFQEKLETFKQPVEVDGDTLAELLTLVEGVPLEQYSVPDERPQLIITKLSLNKKKDSRNDESFQLTLQILHREFKKF